MIRTKSVLVVAAVALGLLGLSSPSIAFADNPGLCPEALRLVAGCPKANAQIKGDSLDLSAKKDKAGTTAPKKRASGKVAPRVKPLPLGHPFPRPGEPGYVDYYTATVKAKATVVSPVHLEDLVNFKPAPGVAHMEPNGWMVVGLDTNFYATSELQVQAGELLGQQANVRFTPASYYWDYGDGKGANLGVKGASWATLGVHEFDHTATSHVYVKPGTYDINLTTYFSAEYQYAGDDWLPVAGVLPVPAAPLHATAGDAKTVLVKGDCSAYPSGPGC